MLPGYVTHYFRRSRGPFLNLSELDEPALAEVMAGLVHERGLGEQERLFGRKYMEMRRLVEERLREGFLAAGGTPLRKAPHYFVLGDSEWFAGLAGDMDAIRLPLSGLPPAVTSVTYGDSFTATGVGPEFGYGSVEHPPPYRGRVFLLSDLADLVAEYGLPGLRRPATYAGYEHRPEETFIEIQLWTDDPIQPFLRGT